VYSMTMTSLVCNVPVAAKPLLCGALTRSVVQGIEASIEG
jgi:hypothetical protein